MGTKAMQWAARWAARWAVVVMAATGCASLEQAERERVAGLQAQDAAARASLETRLRNWMDHPAGELLGQWGIPTQTVSLPDRTQVYEWDWLGAEVLAANDPSAGVRLRNAQAQSQDGWCKERFVADTQGTLTRWTWEGNGCLAQ